MNQERNDEFGTLLRQALRKSAPADPPAGFARAMASLVAPVRETGRLEVFATYLFMGFVVGAAIVSAVIAFPMIEERIGSLVRQAPWPLLLTAAAVFGVIEFGEKVARRRIS